MKILFVARNDAPFSIKWREQVLYSVGCGAKIALEFPISPVQLHVCKHRLKRKQIRKRENIYGYQESR